MWDEITYPFPNFNGSLGMDKSFHPTFYPACDYLAMLVLNHVSKMGPCQHQKQQVNMLCKCYITRKL